MEHHGHSHSHHHTNNKRVLLISFIAIFTFMIVEVIGGLLTNSLALLSDAGHMLSDAAALLLSLLAFQIGEKKVNNSKTFGYRRFEIIAAFINGVTLIVIALFIFIEAIRRFSNPPEVSASMMIIAAMGLLINIFVAWLLMRGETKENLNMKSAFIHVIGDMLGSIAALAAGILIMLFGWNLADPIASIIVAVLITTSGIQITKDSINVLMEGKPSHIDIESMKTRFLELDDVKDIHDLHVWSITSEFPALTCHLVVENNADRDTLLRQANEMIHQYFQISHCTIQIEGVDTYTHQSGAICD